MDEKELLRLSDEILGLLKILVPRDKDYVRCQIVDYIIIITLAAIKQCDDKEAMLRYIKTNIQEVLPASVGTIM